MVFLTESWFWRGTQSAVFYYASCTPWVEYKYKKKRRKDAARSRKDKTDNTIYTQPGVTRQPAPFQTNEEWAQEIMEGPGPPKGWKKDEIWHKYQNRIKLEDIQPRARAETGTSTSSRTRSDWTAVDSPTFITAQQLPAVPSPNGSRSVQSIGEQGPKEKIPELRQTRSAVQSRVGICDRDVSPGVSSTAVGSQLSPSPDHTNSLRPIPSPITETIGSERSSFESSTSSGNRQVTPRQSVDRKLSAAMDGIRDTMRAALQPEKWNWIRYDRDDEILPSLNEKMKSMWESMKVNVGALSDEAAAKLKQIEPKEPEPESEASKWQRGTHPAVNHLHPPIVSQLPYNREEAKWMLMPAPSADVMMGRRRPDPFTDTNRRPLCVIGRAEVAEEPKSAVVSSPVSSDEEFASSSDDESEPGWAHVQRPQRAHLVGYRHRSIS